MAKWEMVNDGYHREQRLVDERTGQILGGVKGCVYDSKGEWDAHVRGKAVPHVGSFVTEWQAMRAVEREVEEDAAEREEECRR